MRVIVIGIDGACLELISPWIEEGSLPTISRMKKEGVFGRLESCLPPVTFPNWKCYSTGKNPGKFGVFWFEKVDLKNRRISIPNSSSFKSKELWDYLGERDIKVGIINMPSTYPPKKVNGILISGAPDAIEKNSTYPSDLERLLSSEFGYKIHPPTILSNREDCQNNIDRILDLIRKRFEILNLLIDDEEVKFLHMTIFYINVLHHFLWNHDLVKRAWIEIDKQIATSISKVRELNEKFNIMIMSDHGMNPIENVFYINTWLENEGYLFHKRSIYDFVNKIGFSRERVNKMINRLRVNRSLRRRFIPDILRSIIPDEEGKISEKAKETKIDWKRTTALASGQGPIYVNVIETGPRYERIRNELKSKLQNIKSPFNNSKVIKKVYKREEIYSGRYLRQSPDLIMSSNTNCHIDGSLGIRRILGKPTKWLADNKQGGLFIFWGSDIKKGEEIHGAKILDLAPTILYMFNVAIPEDMDGRPLKEIFEHA